MKLGSENKISILQSKIESFEKQIKNLNKDLLFEFLHKICNENPTITEIKVYEISSEYEDNLSTIDMYIKFSNIEDEDEEIELTQKILDNIDFSFNTDLIYAFDVEDDKYLLFRPSMTSVDEIEIGEF